MDQEKVDKRDNNDDDDEDDEGPLLKDDDDLFDDFIEKEKLNDDSDEKDEAEKLLEKLKNRSQDKEGESEDEKENKEPKRKRLRMKRKRSEIEQEIEKEESSSSEKSDKEEKEDDDMDVDIYDSEDDSTKTKGISSKDKAKQALEEMRAKKKPRLDREDADTSKLSSLLTFAEEDFDDEDEKGGANASSPSSKQAKESDDQSKPNDASPTRLIKAITHNEWPLLAGQTDDLTVRCTFATREEWSAFNIKGKGTGMTEKRGPRDYSAIGQTHWGIFVPHIQGAPALSKKSSKAAAAAARDEDIENEDDSNEMDNEVRDLLNNENGAAARAFEAFANASPNAKFLKDCPWFVVVGSEALMFAISSPCFASRVHLVAVDPSKVEFKYNPDAPVYYVYNVLNKFPLWPEEINYSWQLREMSRILVDTLYLQMEVLTNGRTPSEELDRILVSITGFPLHATPHVKMLNPNAVPLNSFSARRDRLEVLTRSLIKSVKMTDIGTASNKGVPVVDASDLKTSKLKRLAYLFSQVEKPVSAWRLIERGVPIETITALSLWDVHDALAVRARFALTKPLYVRKLSDVNQGDLLLLASVMRLDPSWFADWYQIFEPSTPSPSAEEVEASEEARLSLYAIFCASAAWHDYSDMKQAYGSNYTFLFSKAQQHAWFESHFHVCSSRQKLTNLMENTEALLQTQRQTSLMMQQRDAKTLAESRPLTEGDILRLRSVIEKHLETMSKPNPNLSRDIFNGVASRLPCLVRLGLGSNTLVLVEKTVQNRVTLMARFVFEVCIRWKQKQRSGALSEPFDKLPPLLVQNAFVYGPSTTQAADEIYVQLKSAVEEMSKAQHSRAMSMVIRASDDPANVKIALTRNLSNLYLLAFDNFHIWPEQLIDAVLSAVTMQDKVSDATHLVITAHGQSLADMTSTGLMLADLIYFSKRMQSRLGLDSGDNANGNLVQLASLGSNSHYTKFLHRGELTEMHYPLAMRHAQFEVNTARDIFQPSVGFQTLLIKYAADVPHNVPYAPVLILHALRQTEAALWRVLRKILQSVTRKQVLILSYENLARRPAMTLGNRKLVVLCDLHYIGPGRPTVQHLNAAFERVEKHLYVLPPSVETQPGSGDLRGISFDNALELLDRVFHNNDEKSDRLATQTERLSLLKNKFDSYYNSKTSAAVFDA